MRGSPKLGDAQVDDPGQAGPDLQWPRERPPNLVGRPPRPELVASLKKVLDQLGELRIARVVAGRGPELCEEGSAPIVPVDPDPATLWIAERHPHDVASPGWQRLGVPDAVEGLVPREEVEPGSEDARRSWQERVEQGVE